MKDTERGIRDKELRTEIRNMEQRFGMKSGKQNSIKLTISKKCKENLKAKTNKENKSKKTIRNKRKSKVPKI